MTPAPILLFTYKRLHVLKQTIDALKNNCLAAESELFIFSDAAKCAEDEPVVSRIRAYLGQVTGFKNIEITEAKTNKGLANSIIDAVSEVIDKRGSVIVLEDDLITAPNFLLFMNSCLEEYRCADKVFSISGYAFNLGNATKYAEDAYFLNRGWSWGWATWKDRWEKVDWQVSNYSEFLADKSAQRAFARGGSDLNKMLAKQMVGKLDSWAIRWFYHQFHIQGLTVYPVLSKVYNAGFDKHATHTTGSNARYLPVMDASGKTTFKLPASVQLNTYYNRKFRKKMGVLSRLVSKVDTYLKRLFENDSPDKKTEEYIPG